MTTISKAYERLGQLLRERDGPLPVWVRPPKTGNEYFSGFSRSKLYAEAAKGHIRSVSIRGPGEIKGTRLFELKSILDFIERNAANAEEVSSNGKTA
jgi:hypothetical protein